ncbi:MAG: FapA family protein [Gammaproteobacteria bacterium]|nr:FapA family protein [Gammaproteobacteria bacterium]
MNEANTKHLQCADIQFRVSDGRLLAEVKADALNQPLTNILITERLKQAGLAQHILEDEVIAILINASTINQTDTITLDAHHDASFEINLEEDQVKAYVIFKPAAFGKAIEQQTIIDELIELGVAQDNIILTTVEKVLSENLPTKAIVAEGKAAIPGNDAYFEVLFETEKEHKLHQDYTGKVDHYESHQYITVAEGTPVLRKIPATNGTEGKTVFGESLEPEPGSDLEFSLNESVCIDPDDENILLAVNTGHPIYNNNVITIDETLSLTNASLETGNIRFNGSVQITGDVKPNVVVEASGDIFVEGLVENATLIAGNTVTIKSGIISSKLYEDEPEDDAEIDSYRPGCRIVATKDLYIKYCNSVHATAGGSIFIENYSLHSILEAKDSIVAGIDNGQGILLGGKCQAEEYIQANIVGSDAYVRTDLLCAQANELMKAVRKKSVRMGRMKDEMHMLNNVLNTIKQQGTPETVSPMQLKKAKKIFREIKENKQELLRQRKEIQNLQQQLQTSHGYRIKINKICYPNVRVRINDAEATINSKLETCTINLVGTELTFN